MFHEKPWNYGSRNQNRKTNIELPEPQPEFDQNFIFELQICWLPWTS